MNKRYLLTLICLTLLLMFTACGVAEQKGAKPSEDWSRSAPVGEDARGSIGLVVDEKGKTIRIVWPFDNGKGVSFRYAEVAQSGETLLSTELSFSGQLRSPRLSPAQDGQLHLVWSSRLSGKQVWELWHALLGANGELSSQPTRISINQMDVGDYAVACDHAGGAVVAWSSRGRGGISLIHLGPAGEVLSGPLEVALQGEEPSLRVGDDLGVHLVWLEGNQIKYIEMPLGDLHAAEGQPLVDLTMNPADSLAGPVVGLSDGWVYVLWSILSQSGLEAGTARTEYVAFPVGEPVLSISNPVWIRPDEQQPYAPYQGSLPLTQLAGPPQIASDTTDYILHPATMLESGPELVVALAANQQLRMNDQLQIAVLVFADGLYKGYAFASKTPQLSDDPVISIDSSGYLYVVWRDGVALQNVYYATTETSVGAALDRLDVSDVVNALLQGSIESLVSIAFMPFVGFGWVLPGLAVIGIWKLFKDQEDVAEPSSWLPLIISVCLYYATKLTTLPTIMTYVPFSAWMHIPPDLELPLRIGVPLVIVLCSFFVAHKARLRYSDSAVLFYVAFTLTDAFLTLVVYGVNFLGVY